MIFAKIFARNYEKKNNIWNIRHLVNESFVPATQRPSILYMKIVGFHVSLATMLRYDIMTKLCFDISIQFSEK